ncbi:putative hydrolase of the HAD superfamily [Bacillus mesophilus]|uniref:HAD family hydrolase n=1 Tax=Bacillus mesophilus TaxID=1808955 RepID=A0A6M0QAH8_9BACI|nr:HAD family hydrolase [Bacillus mesophilus]MBM7662096.1 putative hydrolase of the HAD superfamily [Bacillus mesophilus]NEY72550.1 HAD family hydrolase [Bacillus mesophilus]
MKKAVIFDFDGLIVDTESLWFEVFKEVMCDYDCDLQLSEFATCIGTTNGMLYETLNSLAGRSLDRNEIKEKTSKLYESKAHILQLREGVIDYLEAAKRNGLQIGLASSSSRAWVDRFLNQFQIAHYFKVIKTSDDVDQVKPHPELYIEAVKALGVNPEHVFAFEDSLNGLKAAIGAELDCVIVPNNVTRFLSFEGHIYEIQSMKEIHFDQLLQHISMS